MLHHLIHVSCVTWRTRKVASGDDDRAVVAWHSVDVTGSAFGRSQVTSTDFLGQEAPGKEGENHEDAETRRSAVWTSAAATTGTNSPTIIRGYAASTTSTSILPTLRLGYHRVESTTDRGRH